MIVADGDEEWHVVELVTFPLEGGGSVTVETEAAPGITRAGRSGAVAREALRSFEHALGEVRDAASAALGQFQRMARQPDEVEIRFGVRLDAETGAVIAKAGAQGHFEVRLTWQRSPDQRGAG